jgi:hypothetical protein
MIRHFARTFILTASLMSSAAVAVPHAIAATQFDGRWRWVGIPTTGVCTYPIRLEGQIHDGMMYGDGPGSSAASGRVAPSGAVTFTASAGQFHGTALGQLSGNSGRGTWRVHGPIVNCSGTWTAQRM